MAGLYVAAIVGIALLLAISASVLIVRSNFGSRRLKMLQFLFVWLIPFIGPMVAIIIMRSTSRGHDSLTQSDAADENRLPGIGLESIRDHLVDHGGNDSMGGHGGH
jgi:hypothetical protein